MKKLLLFSLVFVLSSFIFKAYCQEELQEEDTQTTLTKAQQKKLAKEASKQNKSKSSSKSNSKNSKTTTKAADQPQDEYAPDATDNSTNTKANSKDNKTAKTSKASTVKTSSTKKDNSKVAKKKIEVVPEPEAEPAPPVPAPKTDNGDRTYTVQNKSTNPPTYEVLDSSAQGQLNLYRPLNDTNWVSSKNLRQAHDYKAGTEPYPAKPRNMWEFCINVGVPYISGDIQPWFRFGKTNAIGFTVRKALGYVASLRFQYNQGTAYGIQWKGMQYGVLKNPALTGFYDPNVDYTNAGKIFGNYKMTYHAMYGQLVINLNNIKFHRERPKVIFYAVVGGGPLIYRTMMDQLNAQGKMYDYSKIALIDNDHSNDKARRDALKSLWDGTYESYAEQDNSYIHLGQKHIGKNARNYYDWRLDYTACLGMGMSIRLNRRWTLNFETLETLTGDDLLDGQRWQESPINDPSLSGNNDNLNFSSVSLNYNIGSRSAEPLWWLNPMDNQLVVLNEAKNKLARIPEFTDSDNDGVIDFLDREPNTPEGCPVDTHGVMLDSDKDGIPDCRDKEPFSPPGAKVDAEGVAEKKNNPEMDSLMAHIKDLIANGANKNSTFPGWYLPMIHFDLDKDYIKPDFYGDLFHIAQVMKLYPQMKLYVDGHTDIRHSNKYNEELSHRRAENARNFLLKNYGIDPARLIVRYLGKTTNLVKDLPDHYDSRFEREQYINRRVEFTVVPESMQ